MKEGILILLCIVSIYMVYRFRTIESFQELNGGQVAGLSIGVVFMLSILIFGLYFRHEWLKFRSVRQYIHV